MTLPKGLSLAEARSLGFSILARAGVPVHNADEVSDHLLSADASGHGCTRQRVLP